MAHPDDHSEDRDGRSISSDGASNTEAGPRLQLKTSMKARAQTQPYVLGDERKGLRPTDLLSCSECRKRKTKCDRQTPCSGCVQRGKPDLCNPDIRRYPPAAAKLSEELASLREHVQALEAFLSSKFSDYKQGIVSGSNGHQLAGDLEPPSVSAANDPPANGRENAILLAPVVAYDLMNIPVPSTSTLTNAAPSESHTADRPPAANNVLAAVDMQTDRTEQSMASILARFRDSEILGADKNSNPAETSPSSVTNSQALLSESTSFPSICSQVRTSPGLRPQLFLNALLAQSPPPEYCRNAIQVFLKNTTWEIFVVSPKQLLAELVQFEAVRARGEGVEVDPAWLALLFIIISIGLLTAYHYQGHAWHGCPDTDLRAASTHYAELSKAALDLADWTVTPSIRVLQAVLITGWRYHHVDARSNSFDGHGRSCLAYKTLLHVAYEHCCALNIDKIQSDPSATLPNDPSLPNLAFSMRRQLGLRLWFTYLVVETLLSDHQYHRQGPITDYLLPGMYTDDDLLTAQDPGERASTEDASLLYLYLQEVIFGQLWRQTRLAEQSTPLSEITPTVELYRAQLDDILVKLASMKRLTAPPPLGSYQGLVNAIRLFQASAALRVYRPALLCSTFTHDSDLVKVATSEASTLVMISILPETKQVMMCFPPAVSFLYNAATLLLVTLCPEPDERVAASRSALLQGAFRLLQSVEAETRSVAIAANAKKISDALFSLGRALLQEGHGLTYIARQRLEAVLTREGSGPPDVHAEQGLDGAWLNPYDFTFPSATMWGAPSSMDHSTLAPAIWPDAFTSDPMAMSTDIDGWLKWLDAV